MNHDLSWHFAAILTIAGAFVLCGLVALIIGVVRALRQPIEPLYPPHHAVGRDCYRDNYREWTK